MYSDPEQRVREIRNISSAYEIIAKDVLPQLRRSRLNLIVDITGKSDEQIAAAAISNPSSLSLEELLYAATLTNNLTEKAAIYQNVTKNFPNDARGFNNLGVVDYSLGKYAEAQQMFAKAASIDSKLPDINYNLGLVSMAQGNLNDAEQYFGKAAGTTGNLGKALGTMYMIEGDYNKAKSSIGQEVSNNSALLQILNKDYSAARNTLNTVATPDATTSYLQAVIGARTNDRDAVYNNLKASLKLDPNVAKKALTDTEFAKFFTDPTFISLLK
jgi:tetratricopeptide (TPR) repeat protein